MDIPDQLWIPSQKDLLAQFAPIRVSRRVETSTAAAAVADDIYTVPNDYVLMLTHLSQLAAGGGAQTVSALSATIVDAAGNEIFGIYVFNPTTAPARSDTLYPSPANMLLNLVVMPSERVRANATFSAGVAANTQRTSIAGVLIPRGNWQFG